MAAGLPHPILIRPVDASTSAATRELWNLFQHDMSAMSGALPDINGRYRAERLDNALVGMPGWEGWIATAGHQPVGFAIARALDEPTHVLSSFFVVKAARRGGLGTMLASTVIESRPGHWRIAYQDANTSATRFWPTVATRLNPHWHQEHLPIPGRPDLPPDTWISLRTAGTRL